MVPRRYRELPRIVVAATLDRKRPWRDDGRLTYDRRAFDLLTGADAHTRKETRDDRGRLEQAGSEGDSEGRILRAHSGKVRTGVPEDSRLLRLHRDRQGQAREGAGGSRVRRHHREGGGLRPRRARAAQVALPALGPV